MARIYLLTAAALVAGLLGGLFYMVVAGRSDDVFAACRTTQIAGGSGAIGGPFEMVNHEGETVTDADVITKPSLVYFGYTFCPDVCPFDTARNALAVDFLVERGLDVQPVFISVDPRRDTPEVLASFADNLHEDMIALTGSEEQIRAASQAYRTYYRINESDDDFYLVDHSTFTYLVFPEEGFVEFFRRETTAEEMADQVACFVQAAAR